MRGGDGDDMYVFDNSGDYGDRKSPAREPTRVQTYNAMQYLAANIDNLTGLSSAGQRLAGNTFDNVITGNIGNDTITSGDGNDTVRSGEGDDRVYGEAGNDRIDGEAGNDVIYGGDGNDLLHGGQGADVIFGGTGNDTFIFAAVDFQPSVRDTIADFHEIAGNRFRRPATRRHRRRLQLHRLLDLSARHQCGDGRHRPVERHDLRRGRRSDRLCYERDAHLAMRSGA